MGRKKVFEDEFHEKHRKWAENSYKNKANYRKEKQIKSLVYNAIKRNSKKTLAVVLLGCSIDEFKKYIETLLKPDMTWENYGSVWELDHIKGLITFDPFNEEELKIAWNFTNIRPLFRMDHRRRPKPRNFKK